MTATRISLGLALFSLMLVNRASAQGSPAGSVPAKSLAGTTWSGTEDLPGFGKLTFKFLPGDKAVMVDAKSTSEGTYTVNDDEVVVTFNDGAVAYAGKIKGNTLSGGASSQSKNWSWNVTQVAAATVNAPAPKDNAPVPAPAPQNPPAGVAPGAVAKPAPAKVTPETIAEGLRKLGFDPKIITPDIGPTYCVVALKDKDNWTYPIEVKVNNGIWLTIPLDKLPQGAPDNEKLMRLLEANDGISPCYFFFRAADRRMCMKLEVINSADQAVLGDMRRLATSVRMTYDLWNTANWAKETPATGE